MVVFKTFSELSNFLENPNQKGKTIGFVPTMGALHQGHISLIAESQRACALTICSIFVNPTQFTNANDLLKYPRTEKEDLEKLEKCACDIAFIPDVSEVYPEGFSTETINLEGLDKVMEGTHRPGHFDGVVQVVWRFFEQIKPDFAFFGEKDFQQLAVIQKMVAVKNSKTTVVSCPIFRENSGLAMSSRNLRLSESGREKAAFIFQQLQFAKNVFGKMPIIDICATVERAFASNSDFTLEYFEIADSKNLQPLTNLNLPARAFIAAQLEGIRLIDNIALR